MSTNNRYVSHSNVWCHDKEKLLDKIVEELDKKKLVKTYDEKREIRDVIDDMLDDYTMYRCHNHEKGGVVKWRLLYSLLVVFQWVLWPYCFYNWLKTGNFRLNSKSRVGMIIDRIVEQSHS